MKDNSDSVVQSADKEELIEILAQLFARIELDESNLLPFALNVISKYLKSKYSNNIASILGKTVPKTNHKPNLKLIKSQLMEEVKL
jgi:hypothetical protein